jgi:hypothetical protein
MQNQVHRPLTLDCRCLQIPWRELFVPCVMQQTESMNETFHGRCGIGEAGNPNKMTGRFATVSFETIRGWILVISGHALEA